MSKVLISMNSDEFENRAISLTDLGSLADNLKDAGIHVDALHIPPSVLGIGKMWKLARLIKESHPHIVQTWMYHADLLGGIAAKLVTNAPILWNLRQSNFDRMQSKRSSILVAKTCASISSWIPWTIVCGSFAAREVHQNLGYNPSVMQVLPNGFDSACFMPAPNGRKKFLSEIGEPNLTGPFIGLPARYHPQKDHTTFFASAEKVLSHNPDAKFFLCGDGVEWSNTELVSTISRHGLNDAVRLLGNIEKMEGFYPAMDLIALTSAFGEGAPNVLGEAMLCGIPCVATDIGDSAYILGNSNYITSPQNPEQLAATIEGLLSLDKDERTQVGLKGRQRIMDEFPHDMMLRRYEALYRRVYSQCYEDVFQKDS